MPIVAPQPVAFCPSPCAATRSDGSSSAQRAARRPRFSAVTGSRQSASARRQVEPAVTPYGRSLRSPLGLLRGVVELPAVVVVLELYFTLRLVDPLLLVGRGVPRDERELAAAPL